MGSNARLRFAVDLITLYDASLWGVENYNEFYNNAILSPEVFWDRALDLLATTGIEGIEVTFGPGNWRSALSRYGSAEAFSKAVASRGMEVCSGFYTGLVLDGDWRPEQRQADILSEVNDYARFLNAVGSDIMVVGLPMRKTWDADDPMFVDMDFAKRLGDLLNRMGYAALRQGVRLAIHPETNAVFWLRRDLDLFMLVTDPAYVYFCPDTAHITLGDTDPCDVLQAHHQRVILTHWKDAKGRMPVHYPIDENIFRAHHPYFARVGTGEVNWGRWIRVLRDIAYEGWSVIELDAASRPVEVIKEARTFVETSMLPVYS